MYTDMSQPEEVIPPPKQKSLFLNVFLWVAGIVIVVLITVSAGINLYLAG